jgi:hypothetical protein
MENKRLNPFKVLTDPRGFINKALRKTKKAGVYFAALLGMTYLFGKAYTFGLGGVYSLSHIVVFCLILAIPVGFFLLYITSFLLYWVGKIFKGAATFEEVFAAYTWTRLPEVFILLGWFGIVGVFGGYAFTTSVITATPIPLVIIALVIFQMVFAVWEVIILFHALGEVQKISAWVAVWNVLFAWVLLFFIDFSFNWFLIKGFDWAPLANLIFS